MTFPWYEIYTSIRSYPARQMRPVVSIMATYKSNFDECLRVELLMYVGVSVFVQAVMLDSTDVNMWYKLGQVALRRVSIPLARHAFEVGLRCNPDHWPCLDSLITVLYTLSDYSCMYSLTVFFFPCCCLARCLYSKPWLICLICTNLLYCISKHCLFLLVNILAVYLA